MNLHGAAVSEQFEDMDGEITERVRKVIGDEIPFGINLDMHANVSEKMIINTDITNVYQTTPHLDADETGFKCAELVYKTVIGEIVPTQHIETPPMTINIVNHNTNLEPMKSILAESRKLYEDIDVLSVSVAEGYPYSDIKKMGMSFTVITNNNADKAKKYSKKEVICWGSGKPFREFLHVDDLASASLFSLEYWDPNSENAPRGLEGKKLNHLNVGTGKLISIYDLARKIAKFTNYHGEIIWDKAKPDGTPKKQLNIEKILSLGWEPKIKLDDGILETINIYKNLK